MTDKHKEDNSLGCVLVLCYLMVAVLAMYFAHEQGLGWDRAIPGGLCWPFMLAQMVGEYAATQLIGA